MIGNNMAVGGIDQTVNGTNYVWNSLGINQSDWHIQKSGASSIPLGVYQRNHVYTVASDDNGASLIAQLKQSYNISFQSEIGGNITVNGTQYPSPTSSFGVVEQNSITAAVAEESTINYIRYIFQNWSPSGSTASYTFYPTQTQTYVANYTGYPDWESTSQRGLAFSFTKSGVYTYIKLNWNEHPNTNVSQYKIWRKRLVNGSWVAELIGTTNRGTRTFTDWGYYDGGSEQIYYDVKAYYSTEATVSHDNYEVTYGSSSAQSKSVVKTETNISDYSLANYPNPFNPTTIIEYQIPKAGQVTVKVYNSLGKEVAILVNDRLEKGKYNVEFDASSLPTGMYFCEFRSGEFLSTKKMLLVK